MHFIALLWLLTAGHCLADTTLQTDFMARGKKRTRKIDLSRVPEGQTPLNLWWMWLTHHAMIHGLVVAVLTGNPILGMIETTGHWVIDFCKGENYYSPYVDQSLHILMKVGYVIYLTGVVK